MNIGSMFQGVFLLSIAFVLIYGEDHRPRVKTKLGTVVGKVTETNDGKIIYSFTGIPYIQPPVGDRRFRAPLPAEPWDGEIDAAGNIPMCVQKLGVATGVEDCVILNVYTPLDLSGILPQKPLAVIVYIHGGGFASGSSGLPYIGDSDYIVQQDVVLVTINYRVGVMGFLSTEDSEASGNYGLLDQVEALKWVKENIVFFGGNPNEVTIFGHSAGSASVHLLMLSPLTKGLFHRAIGSSGVALCPWATTKTSKNAALLLAEKVGCPSSPTSALVQCLRDIDAHELAGVEIIPQEEKYIAMPFIWSPRVDSEAQTPFLPKHPIELMITGDYNKVPVILGHTPHEGGMVYYLPEPLRDQAIWNMQNNWDNTCKVMLSLREFLVSEQKGSELCRQVKDHYIEKGKSFRENLLSYVHALGHAWVTQPVYKAAELMSKHSTVYSYLFNYESEDTSLGTVFFTGGIKTKGIVVHGDDLLYTFKYPGVKWTKDSEDLKNLETMTKLWADFAKTGKPSIPFSDETWPEASWPNPQYVVLQREPYLQRNYRPEDMDFIDGIYKQFLYNTTRVKDEL